MGIAKALRAGFENDSGKWVEIIGSLCAAAAVVVPVTENIKRTSEAISASGDFMISFVPVYAGIITANGQPISAAGYNTALFAAAQVLNSISLHRCRHLIPQQFRFSLPKVRHALYLRVNATWMRLLKLFKKQELR